MPRQSIIYYDYLSQGNGRNAWPIQRGKNVKRKTEEPYGKEGDTDTQRL